LRVVNVIGGVHTYPRAGQFFGIGTCIDGRRSASHHRRSSDGRQVAYPAAVTTLNSYQMDAGQRGQLSYRQKENSSLGLFAGGKLAALIGTTANNPLYRGNPTYRVTSDAVRLLWM